VGLPPVRRPCSAERPPDTTIQSQPDTQDYPSIDTRPRWPLTGKLLKDEGEARHAAVAVKVVLD
jgi:hypothetical protein